MAAPIEPDTRDWTWVLERPCPECGFVAAEVGRHDGLRGDRWLDALATRTSA